MRELYVSTDAPGADDEPLVTDATAASWRPSTSSPTPRRSGAFRRPESTISLEPRRPDDPSSTVPDGSWGADCRTGRRPSSTSRTPRPRPAASAAVPPPPVLVGKVEDRYGNVTDYRYDLAGHLESIMDPVGLKTTFGYTGNHVTSITDPAGRVTVLGYTGKDLTLIVDPDGSKRTFSYDPHGRKTTEINKLGGFDTDVYDDYGRAIEADRADGSVVLISRARRHQGLPKLNDPATARSSGLRAVREGRGHRRVLHLREREREEGHVQRARAGADGKRRVRAAREVRAGRHGQRAPLHGQPRQRHGQHLRRARQPHHVLRRRIGCRRGHGHDLRRHLQRRHERHRRAREHHQVRARREGQRPRDHEAGQHPVDVHVLPAGAPVDDHRSVRTEDRLHVRLVRPCHRREARRGQRGPRVRQLRPGRQRHSRSPTRTGTRRPTCTTR